MTLIESNQKVLALINRYWKAENTILDWDYVATLLLGAAVVSEYELSLELYGLVDIAKQHGTWGNLSL